MLVVNIELFLQIKFDGESGTCHIFSCLVYWITLTIFVVFLWSTKKFLCFIALILSTKTYTRNFPPPLWNVYKYLLRKTVKLGWLWNFFKKIIKLFARYNTHRYKKPLILGNFFLKYLKNLQHIEILWKHKNLFFIPPHSPILQKSWNVFFFKGVHFYYGVYSLFDHNKITVFVGHQKMTKHCGENESL